jgi:hypothetical protein
MRTGTVILLAAAAYFFMQKKRDQEMIAAQTAAAAVAAAQAAQSAANRVVDYGNAQLSQWRGDSVDWGYAGIKRLPDGTFPGIAQSLPGVGDMGLTGGCNCLK